MELNNHTEEEKLHIDFMKSILEEINNRDTPTYLKGGTSLLLCYGLDRFSEDIDLNSKIKLNLESSIQKAARKLGIVINKITIPKDTDTVRRYKVSYANKEKALKIETSYRDKIEENDTDIVNGIKVYKINSIIQMKLDALHGRTKARDFHDIVFLFEKHKEEFSDKQIANLQGIFDSDNVESYLEDYKQDDILDENDFYNAYEKLERELISNDLNSPNKTESATNKTPTFDNEIKDIDLEITMNR